MKKSILRNIGFGLLSVLLLPVAASAQEGKATLAVSAIKPTPNLVASVKPEKKTELGRVIESLDSQLINCINATRKFDVVGRSDLAEVLKEQDLGASGNVDAKTAAQAGKLTGAKYLLVVTVDHFQDNVEKAVFEGTGRSATKRVFQLNAIGKVYDSTTGKLLESAEFKTDSNDFKQIQEERSYSTKDGELSDEMMVAVARSAAQKIANRIADVVFPAKVIAKREKEVTINRGEGGGLAVGDVCNVYALGEELTDPDTKESLGREEVKVGRVKVTQVNPKTSAAEILDDTGIDKGAILRKSK
jgi:curli biogenesis system outer membrane secretion channel CsgG